VEAVEVEAAGGGEEKSQKAFRNCKKRKKEPTQLDENKRKNAKK
jgi:hypothetical protein